MKIVEGNKTYEINKDELLQKTSGYEEVVVDVGTGDGRFIHKNATKNPHIFYIGIDPSETQIKTYSKKSVKERLKNTLYVTASIELLSKELFGIATKVIINFPWGSLLGGIAKADEKTIFNLAGMLREKGELEITFGYSEKAEPTETERLGLENIDLKTLENNVIKMFENMGFKLEFIETLEKDEIFEIESSWAKKLKFGQERDIFRIILSKK